MIVMKRRVVIWLFAKKIVPLQPKLKISNNKNIRKK